MYELRLYELRLFLFGSQRKQLVVFFFQFFNKTRV